MDKKTFFICLVFLLTSLVFAKHAAAFIPIDPIPMKLFCDVRATNIANKIDDFENKALSHNDTYSRLIDRLTERINKWEGYGYDVDELNDDLDSLNDLVDKYNTDYATFIDLLDEARDISCDGTLYPDQIQEAKDAIKVVRQDVVDIRSLYQTQIRPHILDLKEQEL